MGKFRKPSLSLVLVVFICLAATAGAVSAASISLPGYHNVNLVVANANHTVRFQQSGIPTNTYNFFNNGGIKAVHISNNASSTSNYGQVTNTTTVNGAKTGTFYLTDTGGRGWDDDGILMIAVNGTNLTNLQITINAAGYVWNPVTTGSHPAYNNTTYKSTLSETFYGSNFTSNTTSYNSTWRPCTLANYPLYDQQNVLQDQQNGNMFHLIFVDLYAGIIGAGTQSSWGINGINDGALQVNYTISGLPQGSLVAFANYAYCKSSNQGEGIHWTNAVTTAGNNSGGTSGYYVRNLGG